MRFLRLHQGTIIIVCQKRPRGLRAPCLGPSSTPNLGCKSVPSGKRLQKLWKDPPFLMGKINYFYGHFSIAMLNYQRVSFCVDFFLFVFFLSLSLSLCLNVLRYTHQKKTRTFPNMNPEMFKTGRHKNIIPITQQPPGPNNKRWSSTAA